MTSDDNAVATVSDNSLTFTTTNWSIQEVVSVTGVDDDDAGNESVTISLSATSTDSDYEGKSGAVSVTVTDDDTPDLVITGSPLTVLEAAPVPSRSGLRHFPPSR